jgi:XapX domain-containing protein
MKMYLFSLCAGLMVGVIYSVINVRSPAPPLMALVGLLGILFGEQIIPVGKEMLAGSVFSVAWEEMKCTSHVFGKLPGRNADAAELSTASSPEKCS